MNQFSTTVIFPLERKFEYANQLGQVIRDIRTDLRSRWPKYVIVILLAIMLLYHVTYITMLYVRRSTIVVKSQEPTIPMSFPGIRLCIPQIFRLSTLPEKDIQFLYRGNKSNTTFQNWRPTLQSVVLDFRINDHHTGNPARYFKQIDRYYKACWQMDYTGHSTPHRSNSIKITLNLAEYADIVGGNGAILRHAEVGLFDRKLQDEPDDFNLIHLSPGRHTVVSLYVVKQNSNIRPQGSVRCTESRAMYDSCRRSVQANFFKKSESCSGYFKDDRLNNTSVEKYVQCATKPSSVQRNCGTSCHTTLYKSFKSSANLKYNFLGQLEYRKVNQMWNGLKRARILNSKYNDDYRRDVVSRLPRFIKDTRAILELLTSKPRIVPAKQMLKINFDLKFPNKKNRFIIQLNTYVRLMERNIGRYMHVYHDMILHSAFQIPLRRKSSASNNWELDDVEKNHISSFVVTNSQYLAKLHEILEEMDDIKNQIIKHIYAFPMNRYSNSYWATFQQLMLRDCLTEDSVKSAPFTNDWQQTAEHYTLVDNKLYRETKNISHFYNGTSVSSFSTYYGSYRKVNIPHYVEMHCALYKGLADNSRNNFGIDKQFSYTNIDARFKVYSGYTKFVLNNILQTDDRWGIRYYLEKCNEEYCACNIAIDNINSPFYLPEDANASDKLRIARHWRGKYGREHRLVLIVGLLHRRDISLRMCRHRLYDLRYENLMMLKSADHSEELLKKFAFTYAQLRRNSLSWRFQSHPPTFGLQGRLERLSNLMLQVLDGASFDRMSHYLLKHGLAMIDEIQAFMEQLESASSEFAKFVAQSLKVIMETEKAHRMTPLTKYERILGDIFNETASTMLRSRSTTLLQELISDSKDGAYESYVLVRINYVPLTISLISAWVRQLRFFIVRAKRYLASMAVSKDVLMKNIVVATLFYETHDIRNEVSELAYDTTDYLIHWGDVLSLYLGIDGFNILQLLTLLVTIILAQFGILRRPMEVIDATTIIGEEAAAIELTSLYGDDDFDSSLNQFSNSDVPRVHLSGVDGQTGSAQTYHY